MVFSLLFLVLVSDTEKTHTMLNNPTLAKPQLHQKQREPQEQLLPNNIKRSKSRKFGNFSMYYSSERKVPNEADPVHNR